MRRQSMKKKILDLIAECIAIFTIMIFVAAIGQGAGADIVGSLIIGGGIAWGVNRTLRIWSNRKK